MKKNIQEQKELAEILAKTHLEHTLQEQMSDGLDFFEVSVWSVEKMLLDMYEQWYKDAIKKSK